jgi:hypothetical protein
MQGTVELRVVPIAIAIGVCVGKEVTPVVATLQSMA